MGFSYTVSEKALLSCSRHCCLCHKFCGVKIELHHIKKRAEGGEDTFENCIPLCFDCHAEVKAYNSKHPKGRKFTENELKKHRDLWYTNALSNGNILKTNIVESKINSLEENVNLI
jgi:5-methylcytosine-specific restriction endonuclease McrA